MWLKHCATYLLGRTKLVLHRALKYVSSVLISQFHFCILPQYGEYVLKEVSVVLYTMYSGLAVLLIRQL